jgi:hypothetical protein
MRDVDALYRAVRAREGGESTMLSIVIMRSDAHLREVLRTYEKKYQGNFARDALKKSNNLVGEVIAHILNGVSKFYPHKFAPHTYTNCPLKLIVLQGMQCSYTTLSWISWNL